MVLLGARRFGEMVGSLVADLDTGVGEEEEVVVDRIVVDIVSV